ncbi:MAG: T9SS type A sorting domain-containing protein [Burkholderiales bacterium]|nr:T9SS type A sorting domain-containing protein [Bacteroidia bacterium]
MKKQLLFACAVLAFCFSASAQTTVTITATGTAGSFNTGSVNSLGAKNDGNMININSTTNAGFAKFDLTSLPVGAVVMSANCLFTTFTSTSSTAINNLYGFIGNPASITGTALYTSCTSGTSINASAWTANAANTKTLNATGVTFIQTNVNSPQVCIGFARASTNMYNIYGYPGTAAQQPKLIITYSVQPVCSGAPNAGTATATSTMLCGPQNITLNLSGSTNASGLIYQWQSSPDGLSWTSIPTATTIATTQSVTVPTYFQCIVSCSTNTAVSTSLFINFFSANTYTTVPFLEAFDNTWQNRCDNQNVPTTANWASNPTTGNVSWRRQDAGATATWSTATTGTVAPMGAGCADFHSYYAPNKAKGDLDLYIDMNSTSLNYEMSFYNFNTSGTDSLEVWLSTNGGSSFTKKAGYNLATAWTKQIISLGSVGSASCVVRFRGISDFGNDDLGLDSLKIYSAVCTIPPVAGTITGTNSTTAGSVNTYSIAPATGNLQWYSSPSLSGPWNPIAGATSSTPTITAVGSGTVYYGVIATSPGCPADTTNTPFSVNIIFPGDNVCNPIPLSLGTSPLYNVYGATSQPGEVVPPASGNSTNSGWLNSNLTNSMWFTFVAPASGNVSVQAPTAMNAGANDSQLAIWSATNCASLISQTTPTAPVGVKLIAANDDDANYIANGGSQYSSFVRAACLTPGATYYIQLDTYTAASAGDATTIVITDLGTYDASFSGLLTNYCLPASSSSLTPAVSGGIFTVNTSTTSVTSFSPSTIGTNTVMYSINGCKTTSTTIVAVTPTVTAMSSNTTVCSGSSATLTAGGATNYTWTSGGNSSTEVVTPTSASVYTVTGNASGCSNTATVSVGYIATPTVTAMASNTTVCSGSSATLTASGATNYTWTSGGTSSTEVVTPLSASVYTVTGNTSGCSNTATVSVGYIATPTVTAMASITSVCSGSSATLTASGATTYSWTSGSTSSIAVVTPTGNSTYTITGENNGCFGYAAVSVGVNSLPSVSAMTSNTLLCSNLGESAVLTVSTSATSYTWSNGANTMSTSVTPTSGTTYTVVVNDGNCNGIATVFVDAQICTGINNNIMVSGITIYPNPTNGVLNISISSELAGSTSVEVYDAIGKLVIKDTLSNDTNTINLSKLEDGLYVFKIINNNKTIKVGKVVKQ